MKIFDYSKLYRPSPAFLRYLDANPHVYSFLVGLAYEGKNRRGKNRWSMQGVIEVARWESPIREVKSEFKISHNHRRMMAIKMMAENPSLAGFFTIREDKAHKPPASNF